MDVFSLEEDDGNELFITQEQKDLCVKEDKVDDQSDTFLGVDVMDFQSPCSSVLKRTDKYQPEFSDISDGEWDSINDSNGQIERYYLYSIVE